MSLGYPAGHVLPCAAVDDEGDEQLRLAFDFDGVLVDDEAEQVYKRTKDLDQFRQYELENRDRPLKSGPLMPLFQQLAYFQKMDSQRAQDDSGRKRMLRISIVSAAIFLNPWVHQSRYESCFKSIVERGKNPMGSQASMAFRTGISGSLNFFGLGSLMMVCPFFTGSSWGGSGTRRTRSTVE